MKLLFQSVTPNIQDSPQKSQVQAVLLTTLIWLAVTYDATTWGMIHLEESRLRVFEMNILRTIFRAVNEYALWRRLF